MTGDQTYTSELYVGGNEELDATAITNEYWKSYEIMLQDLQNEPETPNSAPEKDPKANEVAAASRRNLQQRVQNSLPARGCWKKNTCPQLVIRGMQVSGDATGITRLRQSPQIDKVETRSQAPQKLPVEQPQQQSLQHSANTQISFLFSSLLFGLPKSVAKYQIAQSAGNTNFATNTWVPTNGTVKVYPSAYAGERYVENKFYWGGAVRLAAFAQAANSTYEHDFFLNNSSASSYGSGTYLTLEQTGQYTPWVTF